MAASSAFCPPMLLPMRVCLTGPLPPPCCSCCCTTEELKRQRDAEERQRAKEERRKAKAEAAASGAAPAKPAVPATPIAFLFPGQGSQAVGMLKVGACSCVGGGGGPHAMLGCHRGRKRTCRRATHTAAYAAAHATPSLRPPGTQNLQDSKDLPAVRAMLETAKRVLGYDLLQTCLEGPKERLDDTVYSQVGGWDGWGGMRWHARHAREGQSPDAAPRCPPPQIT